MDTKQEILFARTLEQVKKQAKEQGSCIEREQVERAFAGLSLTKEQMTLVFDYLEKNKIGIDRPADPDEFLPLEDVDYLKEYQKELALLPKIEEGEKEAVTLSAMAGEADAQEKLIHIYLPKVVEIAKLYSGQGVFLEDLIGEGNVALAAGVTMLGCLEHQKEAEGMLVKLIMDAMEDHINENMAEADKDRKVLLRVNRVADKARELSGELRRKVTVEELSAETGMSEKMIRDAMRLSGYTIEEIENQ